MRRTPLGALLLLAALAPWFTATAATVSAPDIQMEQGAQARFVVGIDDAAGLSITALDIVLAYDARLVVAELVDTSGAVGSGWLAAYNLLPGEILISIAGARPIARNGPLFSVWFTATKERRSRSRAFGSTKGWSITRSGTAASRSFRPRRCRSRSRTSPSPRARRST